MRNWALFCLAKQLLAPIMHRKTGDIIIKEGEAITQEMLETLESEKAEDLIMATARSIAR